MLSKQIACLCIFAETKVVVHHAAESGSASGLQKCRSSLLLLNIRQHRCVSEVFHAELALALCHTS